MESKWTNQKKMYLYDCATEEKKNFIWRKPQNENIQKKTLNSARKWKSRIISCASTMVHAVAVLHQKRNNIDNSDGISGKKTQWSENERGENLSIENKISIKSGDSATNIVVYIYKCECMQSTPWQSILIPQTQ